MIYTTQQYIELMMMRLFEGFKFEPRKPCVMCRWYYELLPDSVINNILLKQDIIVIERAELIEPYEGLK